MKKTFKKYLSFFISVVMVLGSVSAAVFAGPAKNVIGGVIVKESGYVTSDYITGKVYYDADKKVLTLEDATISGCAGGISWTCDFTLKLTGNNVINLTDNYVSTETEWGVGPSYGIKSSGKLTVEGPGSLTVTAAMGCECSCGVYARDDFVFKSGTITMVAGTLYTDYGCEPEGLTAAVNIAPSFSISKTIVTASENKDGSSPVKNYNAEDIEKYQYLKLEHIENDIEPASLTPEMKCQLERFAELFKDTSEQAENAVGKWVANEKFDTLDNWLEEVCTELGDEFVSVEDQARLAKDTAYIFLLLTGEGDTSKYSADVSTCIFRSQILYDDISKIIETFNEDEVTDDKIIQIVLEVFPDFVSGFKKAVDEEDSGSRKDFYKTMRDEMTGDAAAIDDGTYESEDIYTRYLGYIESFCDVCGIEGDDKTAVSDGFEEWLLNSEMDDIFGFANALEDVDTNGMTDDEKKELAQKLLAECFYSSTIEYNSFMSEAPAENVQAIFRSPILYDFFAGLVENASNWDSDNVISYLCDYYGDTYSQYKKCVNIEEDGELKAYSDYYKEIRRQLIEAIPVDTYTVTIDKVNNGTVSISGEKSEFEENEEVSLTVEPDKGYKLKSLNYKYGDSEYDITSEKQFTMPAADVTVTAEFEEDTVTITIPAGIQGLTYKVHNDTDSTDLEPDSSIPGGATYTVKKGDKVTVTFTPANGYEFDGDVLNPVVIDDISEDVVFGTDPYIVPTVKLSHVHSGSKQTGTPATEEEAGFKDYYECECGKYFEDEDCETEITDLDEWKSEGGAGYIEVLPHTHKPVKVNGQKASEDEAGFKSYYECECGKYFEDKDCKTEIIDLDEWKSEGGAGYIEVLPHTHKPVKVNGQKASEDEAGFKSYYECECGKYFEDEDCENEITDLDEWKSEGGAGYIEVLSHTHKPVKVNGVAATENSAGSKAYFKCECGKCFEDEYCTVEIKDLSKWQAEGGNGYIASLGSTVVPKTGDSSHAVIWITMMTLSFAWLAFCGFTSKKRRYVK